MSDILPFPGTLDPETIVEATERHHAKVIAASTERLLIGLPVDREFRVTREVLCGLISIAFTTGCLEESSNPTPRSNGQ